ncbi:MAG: FAD-dependent oxidoreductase [Bdellovibrio sp.]|nr:MAG: FAD-dependent oxidoreductase [Bdellovibrio sp.]
MTRPKGSVKSGQVQVRAREVLVVGGGFGGVRAVKEMAKEPHLHITLIDRNNHHLFQPLLYQVATAGLSPGEIAVPIRTIFSRYSAVQILMMNVDRVNLAEQKIILSGGKEYHYDYLLLACGAESNYFGHPEWEPLAPSLKSIRDALDIRRRILSAYEQAESSASEEEKRFQLSFVVVGGGPTGVELAGAISEIANTTLRSDFRNIFPESTMINLLEAGPRVLSSFASELSARARDDLAQMKVNVHENCRVLSIQSGVVKTTSGEFRAANIFWTAGVKPSALAASLGVPLDRQGRVIVKEDLSLPQHPNVFVIGDMAHAEPPGGGEALPGVAAVAMQQGSYVGSLIRREIHGQATSGQWTGQATSGKATGQANLRLPFTYLDKGTMATIGRKRAVVQMGPHQRFRFTGFLAWLLWLFVHVAYLIGFRNKIIVLFEWMWSYLTFSKGARLIVGHQPLDHQIMDHQVVDHQHQRPKSKSKSEPGTDGGSF